MKCDNCKFEHCQSSECGTEYYCEIFGYDTPEEFEDVKKKYHFENGEVVEND